MKTFSCLTLLVIFISTISLAKSPVDLDDYFSVTDLKMELADKLEIIEPLLESEESFKKDQDKKIGESVAVIVCIGQAIAEHPQKDEFGINGVALRVAGQDLRNAANVAEAKEAFGRVKKAATEKVESDEEVEVSWGELIDMDALMEEMNTRRSKIRRAIKRLRDPEEDSLHAVSLALLSIAMHEDLSYTGDEADEKKWQNYSKEMLEHLKKLAAVMKAGDKTESSNVFDMVHESCNKCHEAFKDS